MRQRDCTRKARFSQDFFDAKFVGRVGIGMQQAHGNGIGASVDQPLVGGQNAGLVQRHQFLSVACHTLDNAKPAVAWDEGFGLPPEQVVHLCPVAPTDFQHVAESLGRQQPDLGTAAFQKRIQPDGRAMKEQFGHIDLGLGNMAPHGLDDAFLRRLGHGFDLAFAGQTGRFVVIDKVREGAADIDANACCHDPLREGQNCGKGQGPPAATMERKCRPFR